MRRSFDRLLARAQFIICLQIKYNLLIDFWTVLWYNNNVKRRGEQNVLNKALPKVELSVLRVAIPTLQGSKKFLKNFSKTS